MDGDDKKTGQVDADTGWQYKPGASSAEEFAAPQSGDSSRLPADDGAGVVEWSASEFVAHEKNFGWYATLAIVAVLVAAGLYLVTRDVFSTGVVVAMAVILGIAGARKPRTINYRLDSSGLTAGKRFYPYGEYKSFMMPEEGPFTSVVLIPLKRFGFPVSAYLAPDSQDKVLDVLSSHLPLERGQLDAVDRLMRELRF